MVSRLCNVIHTHTHTIWNGFQQVSVAANYTYSISMALSPTGLKTCMSWFLDTRCELLAMHVAVSSLSPVSIQICKLGEGNKVNRKSHHCTGTFLLPLNPERDIRLCNRRLDLDAGIAEELQRRSDVGLQLILDSGHTQQLHLALQTFNHCSHL